MLKKLASYKYILLTYIALMLFWIALTKSFGINDITIGALISILSLFISKKYLYQKNIPANKFHIHKVIKYIVVLLHQIWEQGIKSMHYIITLKLKVKIYHINTLLKDDFLIFILANSISITPGTVVLHREGNSLYVLSLFYYVDNNVASRKIKHPFEDILLEFEKDKLEVDN